MKFYIALAVGFLFFCTAGILGYERNSVLSAGLLGFSFSLFLSFMKFVWNVVDAISNSHFFYSRRLRRKKVLVTLQYLDPQGAVRRTLQKHGVIVAFNKSTFLFQAQDGEYLTIPHDGFLEEANVYESFIIAATGERVSGVRYTTVYAVPSN